MGLALVVLALQPVGAETVAASSGETSLGAEAAPAPVFPPCPAGTDAALDDPLFSAPQCTGEDLGVLGPPDLPASIQMNVPFAYGWTDSTCALTEPGGPYPCRQSWRAIGFGVVARTQAGYQYVTGTTDPEPTSGSDYGRVDEHFLINGTTPPPDQLYVIFHLISTVVLQQSPKRVQYPWVSVLVPIQGAGAPAPNLVVNSTGDGAQRSDGTPGVCDTGGVVAGDPECTLRAAVQARDLDAETADATITFAIPGSGTPVIHPSSPLPDVSTSTVVDGRSQSGGFVALDGSGVGGSSIGVHLTGGTSTVDGLILNGFRTGVQVDGGSGHRIVGDRIGTDSTGSAVGAPGAYGVVSGGPSTQVGGPGDDGNVVVATDQGVFTTGDDTSVVGNQVGVDRAGAHALGPGTGGAIVTFGARSTIRANTVRSDVAGIAVLGSNAGQSTVDANHVGVSTDGSTAVAMTGDGIRIDAAPGAAVTGNVVATGGEADVLVSGIAQFSVTDQRLDLRPVAAGEAVGANTGGGATVQGNTIGLLGDGSSPGPGATVGVLGWGEAGNVRVDSNTIAGQRADGGAVELDEGSGHTITANHLGTDRSGTMAFPSRNPVALVRTTDTTVGTSGPGANVIGGGTGAGILVTSNGAAGRPTTTTIAGNWIGVGPDGTDLANGIGVQLVDADATTVGDNAVGDDTTGVQVGHGSATTTITGNRIGTRGTAPTAAPNALGIDVGDATPPVPTGTTIGPDNVVSGNGTGIRNAGTGTTIVSNRIGVAASTDDPVPNSGPGLAVPSGDVSATGNTIANSRPGIDVAATARAGLHGNRLFGDADAAILHPGTPAAPRLVAAIRTTRATTTRTLLLIDGLPADDTGTIEVFANDSCAEPQARYVLQVTKAKPAGRDTATINLVGRADRSFLTVDYTDSTGNTSELSGCQPAGSYPDGDGDGAPDVLEQFVAPGAATDPTLGVVYTDTDQILLAKTSAGRFTDLGPADDPSPLTHPDGLTLPYGLISFEVHDLPADGEAEVAFSAGPGTPILARSWAKYGSQPDGTTGWYDFGFDPATQTGAGTATQGTPDQLLVLFLRDGARGDEDLSTNGVIHDPGGPATFAGPTKTSTTGTVTTTGTATSGTTGAPATSTTTAGTTTGTSPGSAPTGSAGGELPAAPSGALARTGHDLPALLGLGILLLVAGALLARRSSRSSTPSQD